MIIIVALLSAVTISKSRFYDESNISSQIFPIIITISIVVLLSVVIISKGKFYDESNIPSEIFPKIIERAYSQDLNVEKTTPDSISIITSHVAKDREFRLITGLMGVGNNKYQYCVVLRKLPFVNLFYYDTRYDFVFERDYETYPVLISPQYLIHNYKINISQSSASIEKTLSINSWCFLILMLYFLVGWIHNWSKKLKK